MADHGIKDGRTLTFSAVLPNKQSVQIGESASVCNALKRNHEKQAAGFGTTAGRPQNRLHTR
jgi:hypothetical protein